MIPRAADQREADGGPAIDYVHSMGAVLRSSADTAPAPTSRAIAGRRPRTIGRVSGRAINDSGVAVGGSITVNYQPSQAVMSVPGSAPQSLGFLPDGRPSPGRCIERPGT